MEQTALTVVQRAALVLAAAEHEKKLVELAKQSTAIVAITNPAGYQECHSARMALKTARVSIEKTGKSAREDATAFAKAVIAEEKRLIGIIQPEESRLQAIQDAHDAKVEAERAEKIRIEQERMAGIQARIGDLATLPGMLAGKSPAEIAVALEQAKANDPATWAQEFLQTAQDAKARTVAALEQMHAGALAAEAAAAAEAKRISDERAELARLRAAEDQRKKEEASRVAEEEKRKAAAAAEFRRQIEEEERASRERIAEQERQARAARDEADRQAKAVRDAEEARLKAERDRLEGERRAEEAKQREIQRKQNELLDARAMLETFVDRFGHIAEFQLVVQSIRVVLPKEKIAA